MSVDGSRSSSDLVPIYAILVGIDTYSPPFSPLNKAVGDVKKLKKLLMNHPQIRLKEKDIKILTNENATREKIIEALSSLPKRFNTLTWRSSLKLNVMPFAHLQRR